MERTRWNRSISIDTFMTAWKALNISIKSNHSSMNGTAIISTVIDIQKETATIAVSWRTLILISNLTQAATFSMNELFENLFGSIAPYVYSSRNETTTPRQTLLQTLNYVDVSSVSHYAIFLFVLISLLFSVTFVVSNKSIAAERRLRNPNRFESSRFVLRTDGFARRFNKSRV